MKRKFSLVHIFTLLLHIRAQQIYFNFYDLPTVDVKTDQLYLQKKQPTNLTCTVGAGWSEHRVNKVTWYKDEEILKINNVDYQQDGPNLSILGVKQQNEGIYQCLAEMSQLKLTNGKFISTNLMSSPLKMRRARLTKFDTFKNHGGITVGEMEVARLPCAGMPDVVPGPPKICFQRIGQDECLGSKNDTKYLVTNSGMQISLVQPSDAGFYHCVVTNMYMNLTRISPNPVLLYVRETNRTAKTDTSGLSPSLIYPVSNTTVDDPIIIDVTEGDEVILECVMSMANIAWMKQNDSTPVITINDTYSRFQQVWGNLRIRSVASTDSGTYSCVGLPMVGTNHGIEESTKPRVDYRLNVHLRTYAIIVPTIGSPMQTPAIECYGENMDYEIPMMYLNGVPMAKSSGLFSEVANLYSNPIKIQYKPKSVFSISLQCASRPAMEEAEVYGEELDRGRSKNIYMVGYSANNPNNDPGYNVTVKVGEPATLRCPIDQIARGLTTWWTKDGKEVVLFGGRTSIGDSYSLQLENVQESDQGWYFCNGGYNNRKQHSKRVYLKVIEPFSKKQKDNNVDIEDVHGFVTGVEVRLQWTVLATPEATSRLAKYIVEAQRLGDNETDWFEIDTYQLHVRATTVKGLVPNNKYKMRVRAIREDGSTVTSQETNYMTIDLPNGDVIPTIPQIHGVYMIDRSTARVVFSQIGDEKAAAKTFYVFFRDNNNNSTSPLMTQVDGTQTEALVNIKLDTEYVVKLIAENAAGKTSSEEHLFKTTTTGMFLSTRIYWDTMQPYLTFKNVALFGILLTLSALMILICFVVFCNLRSSKGRQKSQANGKFLDTSYRIFNEQKVHKSQILDDTIDMDADECSPLKMKQVNETDSDKFGGFNQESNMPNLYGNLDDMMGMECSTDLVPNDPTYVSSTLHRPNGGTGDVHNTARCYSPESRTSHEMLVSYSRNAHSTANSASPQLMNGGSIQRVKAYNYPDSLLYSPAGTTCSIAETTSSGLPQHHRCDSPNHPQSDESANRYGGSSRNSHISSSDGSKVMSMGTFKGSNVTNSFADTFDRRRSENVA